MLTKLQQMFAVTCHYHISSTAHRTFQDAVVGVFFCHNRQLHICLYEPRDSPHLSLDLSYPAFICSKVRTQKRSSDLTDDFVRYERPYQNLPRRVYSLIRHAIRMQGRRNPDV